LPGYGLTNQGETCQLNNHACCIVFVRGCLWQGVVL
jgi:hypothetical protein